jgi:MOSC domain-containing protein YiiM
MARPAISLYDQIIVRAANNAVETLEKIACAGCVEVRQLYISVDHNFFGHHGKPPGESPMVEVAEIECVASRGLRGDRFFDFKENYKGQITFFAWETYEAICRTLAAPARDKPPSTFRRNVITAGVDLNALIGQDFQIQGVRFRGTEECRPCYWMDQAFAPGAFDFLKGWGGLRAVILSDGILRANAQ